MIFIPEQLSSTLITHELAYRAVREALMAVCATGKVFPAVIAHGSDPGNRFSLKSAVTPDLAGVKIGFNWASNKLRGLPPHNSATILLDQDTGAIAAVIEAGVVNAYRTAAADAVATDALARHDARQLAVFGAGHQAGYECLAIARVRAIEMVHVVARDPAGKGRALVEHLAAHGVPARLAENAEKACACADIIVTATPSKEPLFDARWLQPGTHVSCMGTDSRGKQEVPVALLERAQLFCDLPAQSTTIGEFQHVADAVAKGRLSLTAIGAVLAGHAQGRNSDEDITVFDSSGIALQDLYVGRELLKLAHKHQQCVSL